MEIVGLLQTLAPAAAEILSRIPSKKPQEQQLIILAAIYQKLHDMGDKLEAQNGEMKGFVKWTEQQNKIMNAKLDAITSS